MQYMVMIKKKTYNTDNDWFFYHDSLLAPDSDFDSILSSNCEELGLCEKCYETCDQSKHCHIMRKKVDENGEYYDKLCPILFSDLVSLPFKVEDLV